jgi:large subunit ribosomal protein L9
MKIILNKDVDNLGEEGDVCDVARGYARNYLFPKELALVYKRENIAKIENRRVAIEKRKEEKRQSALGLKERIEEKEIIIKMNSGQGGKLFGSVTNTMIADELKKEGIEIEKKKIEVSSNSMKMLGTYSVRVRLYESNEAQLTVKVVNQNTVDASGAKSEEAPVKKEKPVIPAEVPAEQETVEESAVEEAAAAEEAEEESAVEEEAVTVEAEEAVEEKKEAAAKTEPETEAEAAVEDENAAEEEALPESSDDDSDKTEE